MDELKTFMTFETPCDHSSQSHSVSVNNNSLFFENLKWLTAREAVVYLRLPSLGALRNLVYRRKVPFHKLGRNLRFNRQEIDRFLESSKMNRRISI